MPSKKTTKRELIQKTQLEKSLQREPAFVSAVLRTIGALVTVLDHEGRIVSFNRACEEMTGYSFAEVEDRCFWDFLLTADEIESVKNVFGRLRAGQFPNEHENYWVAKDGTRYLIHWTNSCLTDSSGAVEYVIGTGINITEQRRALKEREVAIEFLRLVNASADTRRLVEASVRFFHEQSGCEAVGIRLRDGDDYPYYEAHGFPEEFLHLENSLCVRNTDGTVQRDHAGEPVMACMCGNVICGRFDPSKSFFTRAGSFWANDTTRLLAMTTDADRQDPTRNRCNGEGYESVALIALRSGEEPLGLLQLNDRRKGMFTPEIVAFWERLAGYLGVALGKARAEATVLRNQQTFTELVERAPFGIYVVDSQFRIAQMNAGSQNGAFRNVRPAIGRDFSEAMRILWPEPVAAEIIAVFRHTLETGEPYYSPRFTNPRHDVEAVESYKWELHRITLPDSQYGVICYYFDFTQLRQAEETIRQQADMLRLSFDAVIVWRLEGGIEVWNRGAEELYGFTPDEAVGLITHDFLRTVFPVPLSEIESILKDRGTWQGELRHRTKDDREVIVSARLQLIRGGDSIVRVLEINRDITARKQAEEALRESERRFRTMADAIPQLAWIAKADGYIYWYNQRWYQYTGTTPEQMEGWGWQSVHDPQELPKVLERWKASIATGKPFDMIFPLRGADGVFRPFLTRVMPLKDERGKVQQWFGTNTDVTEQKRAEEALRESERMYRAIGESIDYGVWICDFEGRNIYASDSFLKLVGITQQQCSDFGWGGVLHPEDSERTITAWKECVGNGGIWDIEHRFRGVDGKWHPVLARGVPVRNEQGQIVRWAGINLDIGRLKGTEEALRESEAKYRSLFQHMLEGFAYCQMMFDESGHPEDFIYLAVNDNFEKLTGLESVTGRRVTEVIPDIRKLHPEVFEIFGRVALTANPEQFEIHFRPLSRYLSVSAYSPEKGYFVAVFQDITKRKKAEEELVKSRAELEDRVQERTKELSQTAAALADEVAQRIAVEQDLRKRSDQLRSLASELTLTEQRERMRLAQILHDGLQQILVAAKYHVATAERSQHLKSLINEITDLLDDAIETSRSLTSELSPPILREGGLVPAIEWLVRWMHDKHGLDIRLTVRDNIDPSSEDIVLLLFQATRELLFNVVKHAFAKNANLELAQTDGHIHVIVEDKGVGFDPTEIPAQRGDSGGFGLFSIRERISLFGGQMEIYSAPGQGSRFKLIVPLSAGMIESRRSSEIDVSPVISLRRQLKTSSAKDGIRIVLVDDHIIVRQGIAGLLAGEPDFEIIGEASDGASAVDLVRDVRPDVVLMDISMPGMNGIEATRIIHKEWPDMRIIGLSMYMEGDQAAAMFEAGAAKYISKIGPGEDLIAAIRACAHGRTKSATSS